MSNTITEQLKILAGIYEVYNLSEHEPDIVDSVDTINYLLGLLGFDEAVYEVVQNNSKDGV